MQMAGENLRVDLFQPIQSLSIAGFASAFGEPGFGAFCFGNPAVSPSLPIELLKIEKTHGIQFFRELRAGIL